MRRSYGTVDIYTRKISGSKFDEEDAKMFYFATLAGPIAVFFRIRSPFFYRNEVHLDLHVRHRIVVEVACA